MYGFHIELDKSFETTVTAVIQALKVEGFGIMSRIDVQAAMKEKLGMEVPPHLILGACNPPLAQKAMQVEPEIGLLLPCNITVRATRSGRSSVGFIDPQIMVRLTGNAEVAEVADQVGARLARVRMQLKPESRAG